MVLGSVAVATLVLPWLEPGQLELAPWLELVPPIEPVVGPSWLEPRLQQQLDAPVGKIHRAAGPPLQNIFVCPIRTTYFDAFLFVRNISISYFFSS